MDVQDLFHIGGHDYYSFQCTNLAFSVRLLGAICCFQKVLSRPDMLNYTNITIKEKQLVPPFIEEV